MIDIARTILRVLPGAALVALLILAVGCAPHTDSTTEAGVADEETVETMERKAPPFFFFRSGAGLTSDGPEGD